MRELHTRILCTASLLAFAAASPAYAQDNNTCTPEQAAQGTCTLPPAAQTAQEGQGQTVEVTGSRIRRPNLESTVPITSLTGDQIFQTSDTNVGETLNELPQLRSTFAQQNPGLGIGIAGLNLLDLRGLGTARTLVLVNGRRHVAADILNNAVSPDVGSIPNDLIERIDIVTGGNSAIYGSDAIAGVVNFVLRRDFHGLQLRAQASTTEAGYGSAQFVSAMYGLNFNDGAGNITLHGEYSRQERVFASDIPWYRSQNGFFAVDADANSGGNVLVNGSDGFPDAIFIRDVRTTTNNPRGLVPIAQRADNPATPAFETGACGNGTLASFGGPNSNGNPYNCTYIFTDDGRLTPQTGARFGAGPTGGIIGGNGATNREGQTLSVLPFLERYNANLLFHYTFSPAFEFFFEGKWARLNALGNNAGPSFIQGQNTQFDFRELPRLDNPFLNAADRTTLANLILASGCRSTLATVCPAAGNLSAADIANIANGSYRFTLARNLFDFGIRDENFQRDTWRVVGGFRGTFNDDWSYEISANYGRFDQSQTTSGFIDRQRFMLSMDAGRNPITGQIQCRSQFDPASAIVLQRAVSAAQVAGNAASLAADIAACVPYNPFGAADNRAAVAYASRTFTATASLSQLVLNGFMSGDTSGFFNLPGGPVRFAIGAEYRREKANYEQDSYVTDGFTNGVSIPTFSPPAFTVKEAFAELQLPILREQPFAYELTLSGAARVARYQGGTGTVWSYNAGVDWAPIRDIRFRGNYSRAVRAPNVSETGFPLVPNFAPNFQDPCNQTRITANGALRQQQCTAAVGANLVNLPAIVFSLPIVSGSNPNLTAETSDSWTFGAVIQPRWIPGLSISVDYYNIAVNKIIANLGAQAIVDACYDAPQPNVFCSAFTRWAGPGNGPNGELPGAILGNSLIVAPLNFASRVRRGIDTQIAYRVNLSSDVRLNTNLIYTHNLEINNFQDQLNPTFANRILGELGDPVDEFRLDVDLSYRNFTFGYRMHYIGPMYIAAWENNNGINGFPPANDDAFEIRKYPAITYNDIRFEWNINNRVGFADSLRFYFGVDNIFDRHPPLGLTATGAGAAIYDIRGRSYYAGIRARF